MSPSTASGWRLGRRPELDGLRGVAISLVLACHVFGAARGNDRYFAWGSAGVVLFFTLSGFLITSLLLEGQSLGRFYRRRLARLLPALAAVVAVLGALMVVSGRPLFTPVPIALYYANWALVAGHDVGILRQSWSLAIEEQFYLVWPLVLLAVSRWRRGPLLACAIGVIASTAARLALLGAGGERVYYGTDTQAAGLLVGAGLAVLVHRGLRPVQLPPWTLLCLLPWVIPGSMWIGWAVVPTVVPLIAAGLIWSACCTPGGVLANGTLRYLGRRSYALYLWHYPIILLVRLATGPSLLWGLVSVALALGLAELSWWVVERPFLRTSGPVSRSRSTERTSAGDPSPAGVPAAEAAT